MKSCTLARAKVVLLLMRSMGYEYAGHTGEALDLMVSAIKVLSLPGVVPPEGDEAATAKAMRAVRLLAMKCHLPRLMLERYGPRGSDNRVLLNRRILQRKGDVAPDALVFCAWANHNGIAYRFGGRNLSHHAGVSFDHVSNEVWAFDPNAGFSGGQKWQLVKTVGRPPSARAGSSAVMHKASGVSCCIRANRSAC